MPTRSNDHTAWHADRLDTSDAATDGGYTLIELLMVVLILGVLLGAAILAVGGVTTEAADTGCDADRRQLDVAVGAYEAQTGNDTIDPTPGIHEDDRYEQTLVEGGFLRSVSEYHVVDAGGTVTPQEGSSC
ncbi:prepilin-type N-terminal cleavage/methylation domain-containing protein [Ilumatobacter fluminis]|uniref:Prepilin-type N-terminal cleavage/methylation domain-containing protein n=1 Tax=Ilumatobacter fluminis TaxID=467091 RepID=A0A4R7I6J0_9ACTN|nr:type II secretion system protein [Ilumatobacter fluminis]TDT18466.1 prepilin-type N-terminal cleavage/methylation domain-containing protein [Ilumatobacter fluminis]